MAQRHHARGYWLEQAGEVEPAPALEGELAADVVVVGGGYTGMWTAWQLKRLEPDAEIALLEAGVCGEGPSGRNGGFCNALWFSLPTLRERFGDAAANDVAIAAQAAVDGIGAFCAEQGVDAHYTQAGYLQVSTAPAWDGAWEPALTACEELGHSGNCVPLTPEQVRERCDAPRFRGAGFYPGAATVQPALLARGLRARLLEAGVRIRERSAVQSVKRRDGDVVAATPSGTVRATAAVLAGGGKLVAMPRLRRRLTLTSSHMVITEPVPEYLEEIGWTGGECITDTRAMVHYFRTTRDGRIAFGWGGGRVAFGARTNGRAEVDPAVAREVERHLLRFFPGLEGRRVEQAWGGPIDVSPSHLPVIDTLEPGIHCAYGYTGHGVGPSHMVGRSLASMALDRRDGPSRLALIAPAPVHVPPEPFRFIGGTIIRRALLRKESALEQGRRPGPVTRVVAGIPERIGIHVGR